MKSAAVAALLLVLPWMAQSQILYTCTSPNRDTVTYLLGTSHVLPFDRYHHDPRIDSLVGQSAILFTEHYVPATDPLYRQYKKKLEQATFYKDKQRIDDFLSAADAAFLYRYYDSLYHRNAAYTKAVARKIAPFFHQLMLVPKGEKAFYLDKQVYIQAMERQIKVVPLDDATTLLAGYQALAEVYTPQWLVNEIRSGKLDQHEDPLDAAYLDQDTSLIKRCMANNPDRQSPRYDNVIKNRNIRWEALIEKLGTKSNFVACGIAHLLEDDIGLIYYFKRKGYHVEGVSLQTKP